MKVAKPTASTPQSSFEMGSSSKEHSTEIDDSGFNYDKGLCYKSLQQQDYKVMRSNGEFICPFCAYEEDADHDYTHLLRHANRVAEGSLSREQRAKHLAMARYLAFDLAEKAVKPEAVTTSACDMSEQSPNEASRKRSTRDGTKCITSSGAPQTPARKQTRLTISQKLAMAEKREKEALDKLEEVNDQLNALIAKDRLSNDKLRGVHRELIKGLSDIQPDRHDKGNEIGIKRFGELDSEDFISGMRDRFPAEDSVIKGVELCTLWQGKLRDLHWYPFHIIEDANGLPKRLVKDDDVCLCALKEEWGRGIHDAVFRALTDLQEHNSSGCYMVPELWNFLEGRKAELDEVVRYIFRLGVGQAKAKSRAKPKKKSKG